MQALILASTSRYRRELLARLGLPFATVGPNIDETPRHGESAEALATRLAIGKAETVAAGLRDRITKDAGEAHDGGNPIIIGSDQVATCGETLLGKPGDVETAIEQLLSMAGQAVFFHTAVYLLRPGLPNPEEIGSRTPSSESQSGREKASFIAVDRTSAVLRNLTRDEIEHYVEREPSLDCAGSFKIEGLGISLFSELRTSDPTALVGLPLIAVCHGLRELGVRLP